MNDYKLKGLICLYNCGKLVVDPENRSRNHLEWVGKFGAFVYSKHSAATVWEFVFIFIQCLRSLSRSDFCIQGLLRPWGLLGNVLYLNNCRSLSRSDFCITPVVEGGNHLE